MSQAKPRRAAIYARVSTHDQVCSNQLLALHSFAEARGWTVTEFVDHHQSGVKEKRPALDAMLAAVRPRKVAVVACVKLDRLARSGHHLVAMVREFEALGVDLVVLDQAIDTTTPSAGCSLTSSPAWLSFAGGAEDGHEGAGPVRVGRGGSSTPPLADA